MATKKNNQPRAKAPQIPLDEIFAAIDRKDRDYYDNLDDELKKKFTPFMMIKYAASLGPNYYNQKRGLPLPSPDMERYYIEATNYYANKNMFDISSGEIGGEHDHRKLQWLLLTTISPGMGDQSHFWIKSKPKPKNAAGPIKKELAELFPQMKDDDLDVLASLTTKKELNQYIKDHGEK